MGAEATGALGTDLSDFPRRGVDPGMVAKGSKLTPTMTARGTRPDLNRIGAQCRPPWSEKFLTFKLVFPGARA
jgi:hypothetical protein